ncbi:MAG: hypothetical protein ACE5IQ_00900 [Candidatus Methylomirabilales bacterium]
MQKRGLLNGIIAGVFVVATLVLAFPRGAAARGGFFVGFYAVPHHRGFGFPHHRGFFPHHRGFGRHRVSLFRHGFRDVHPVRFHRAPRFVRGFHPHPFLSRHPVFHNAFDHGHPLRFRGFRHGTGFLLRR